MTYQMRRMILVNVGTNLRSPSGRISEIDPRGGAAIVGSNGVGKTSTLRLIPLFLGTAPSQILAPGKGQEAIIPFALPTPHSALVFEYQRGKSETHDIRMAVIRRRLDGSDSGEYRLFDCAYHEALFARDGYFLDDEQSIAAARDRGITFSQKLTGSEYRSVILGLRPNHKDAMKLRRLADVFSFGPKPLPNLDRLVAAMIKERVSFVDMIQVAVGMVQEELGIPLNQDRNRMALKQNKSHIASWLVDRDVCAEAVRLKPQFIALRQNVDDHAHLEGAFRALRADVKALSAARQNDTLAMAEQIQKNEESRILALREQEEKKEEISRIFRDKHQQESEAKLNYAAEKSRLDNFEKSRAAHWAARQKELPTLHISRKGLVAQIESLSSEAQNIRVVYDAQIHALRLETAQETRQLETSKDEHRERHGREEHAIAAQEREALEQQRESEELQNEVRASKRSELDSRKAVASLRRDQPAASRETILAAELANKKMHEHHPALLAAQKRAASLNEAASALRVEFGRAEQACVAAAAQTGQAREQLLQTQQMLAPKDGSLLSALRSHPDRAWAANVAKVIDPSLLVREDLDAAFVDDADAHFYGWALDLEKLPVASWADDRQLRQLIDEAQKKVAVCETAYASATAALTALSERYAEAQAAVSQHAADVSILEAQQSALGEALELIQARLDQEVASSQEAAQKELQELNGLYQALQAETIRETAASKAARTQIQQRYGAERQLASARRDEAIGAITGNIERLQTATSNRIADIEKQCTSHLSRSGVDVERLHKLQADLVSCKAEIDAIEKNMPLVDRYAEWQEQGGHTLVLVAEQRWQQEHAAVTAAQAEKDLFFAALDKEQRAYEKQLGEMRSRLSQAEQDLSILAAQEDEFGDYQAASTSMVDLAMPASSLRAKVSSTKSQLRNSEKAIETSCLRLKSILCARESAVKTFVDASLASVDATQVVAVATALHMCYQRIGQQIITNVNTTLTAVLSSIALFHQGIQDFETAVGRFNAKLQKGLSSVTDFERVREVKIAIATNFGELDFVKKLDQINDMRVCTGPRWGGT
jgi:hypothetical protein